MSSSSSLSSDREDHVSGRRRRTAVDDEELWHDAGQTFGDVEYFCEDIDGTCILQQAPAAAETAASGPESALDDGMGPRDAGTGPVEPLALHRCDTCLFLSCQTARRLAVLPASSQSLASTTILPLQSCVRELASAGLPSPRPGDSLSRARRARQLRQHGECGSVELALCATAMFAWGLLKS